MSNDQSQREQISENFYRDEFDCPCCGLFNVKDELLVKLQKMRSDFNKPMPISSGTRCIKHNKKVGGSEMSDHILGRAVDVACSNAIDRRELVRKALQYFPTVGIKKDCIHLSIGLPARIFTYD